MAQKGGDGRGTTRAVLPLLLGPSQMTHTHGCAKKYHACCVLRWLSSVRCTAMSLCERWFLTLGEQKKSSGNHNLPPALFVCLETPKPQSLFLEGGSGSGGEGKLEGRRKVRAD